jgi:hypothetical protein
MTKIFGGDFKQLGSVITQFWVIPQNSLFSNKNKKIK